MKTNKSEPPLFKLAAACLSKSWDWNPAPEPPGPLVPGSTRRTYFRTNTGLLQEITIKKTLDRTQANQMLQCRKNSELKKAGVI